MDKLVVPTPSNGFPLNNDDIRFFLGLSPYSRGVYQALEGILKAYGDNFIVSGCEITAGTMAEGWVMLDGELLKVDSHSVTDDYFEKVVTYNAAGNKQTQLGSTEDSYQQNRATSTASGGNLKNNVTNTKLLTKIIDIGDWNMDSNGSIGVSHGLDFNKIKKVSVYIRNDADTSRWDITSSQATGSLSPQICGGVYWDATRIFMSRHPGGYFDDSDFSNTSYNRGEIIIEYIL